MLLHLFIFVLTFLSVESFELEEAPKVQCGQGEFHEDQVRQWLDLFKGFDDLILDFFGGFLFGGRGSCPFNPFDFGKLFSFNERNKFDSYKDYFYKLCQTAAKNRNKNGCFSAADFSNVLKGCGGH